MFQSCVSRRISKIIEFCHIENTVEILIFLNIHNYLHPKVTNDCYFGYKCWFKSTQKKPNKKKDALEK